MRATRGRSGLCRGRTLAVLIGVGVGAGLVMSAPRKPTVVEARYSVRFEEHVRVPMRDGRQLSANVIRPDAEGTFPVIIEYHPYRKDDVSHGGHDVHHYFAERGFVGVRLDVRGTGGSEGTNTDEYLAIEQRDGFDAVEWFATRPYANGKVGMFGTSYGGFTAVQVAMNQPPHLKAIAPQYATDDRYTDDCHYTPGGNMRMYYDVGTYGGSMVAMNMVPPVPEVVGADWAELWKHRLENNEPYIPTWMAHQTDGPYWRGASLRPGYDRIKVPTFLIAGWRDGYVNAMLRMYQHLNCPKKLWIGPWVHTRPNASVPGPRVDYVNELCRFFGEHLRGDDTGFSKEPPLSVYMQESHPPERTLDLTPGHWRDEPGFPATGTREETYFLASDGRLTPTKPADGVGEFEYRPTAGLANGYWSAGGMAFYLADDQRTDEAFAVTFTTEPFRVETHLLGWPKLVLYGAASAPVATFVAKLADVAPDGKSTLITDGSLNGTRRKSLTDPEPMMPGDVYELNVPMQPTGWVVKPGHRLRLAISGGDFPNLWPTPYAATQRVEFGRSRLTLPIVPASKADPVAYLPPPVMKSFLRSFGRPPSQKVELDQITGTATVSNHGESVSIQPANRGRFLSRHGFRCTANSRDPAQASIVGQHTFAIEREDGTTDVTAESAVRATATHFHITITLNVTRNGKPFFTKTWTRSEPRRLL